jgi:hypothetical protein
VAVSEKVKKYITVRNACEGAAGSGSSEMKAPPTPAAMAPVKENTGAPSDDAAQDGVDN